MKNFYFLYENLNIMEFLNPVNSDVYDDDVFSFEESTVKLDRCIQEVYYELGINLNEGMALPPPPGPDPMAGLLGGGMPGSDPMAGGMGAPAIPPGPPPPQTGPIVDPGTGLKIPPKIDPTTGLEIPRTTVVGNPSDVVGGAPLLLKDINKLNELNKIHNYLISLKKTLDDKVDREYEKVTKMVTDSMEYFYKMVKNMDSFTNFIDDIILNFKKFILVLSKEVLKISKLIERREDKKFKEKRLKKKMNKKDKEKDMKKQEDNEFVDLFDDDMKDIKRNYGDGPKEEDEDNDGEYNLYKKTLKKLLRG